MSEHDPALRRTRQEQPGAPQRKPLGVICWDFDGTLAHRPDGWSGTLAAALREQQPECAITTRDIAPLLRQGFPWHTPEVGHPELSTPEQWWAPIELLLATACVRLGVSDTTAADAAQEARRRYLDMDGWIVYDDVRPALAGLTDAGWRHAIISNHVPELSELVDALGLSPYFDHVLTSAVVGYEKPHPAIYRAALEAAGMPDRAWMIGDNVEADVLGAETVGLRAILVRKEDSRARHQCAGLHEVAGIISSIPGGDSQR